MAQNAVNAKKDTTDLENGIQTDSETEFDSGICSWDSAEVVTIVQKVRFSTILIYKYKIHHKFLNNIYLLSIYEIIMFLRQLILWYNVTIYENAYMLLH